MNRRTFLSAASSLTAHSLFGDTRQNNLNLVQPTKKNLVIITSGLGFNPHAFNVKGDNLSSSPLIEQLKDHHNNLTVIKNISQPEMPRGHAGSKGLLTCNRNQTNGPYISIDQLAAENIAKSTYLKSVNATKSLSWGKNGLRKQSLGSEIGSLFKALFSKTELTEELIKKQQILKKYKNLLKPNLRGKAAYLAAVNELEKEAIDLENWSKTPVPKVDFEPSVSLTDRHGRGSQAPFEKYLEVTTLGIRHKRANIFTLNTPYITNNPEIKLNGSYHSLGHQLKNSSKGPVYDEILKVESYTFKCISTYLTKLKKENLLDDTIVMIVGGFYNAGTHSRKEIPIVVAGGGFKHNGVIECKNRFLLANFYVTILHQMGVDINEFSSYKGNMDKLLIS